MQQEHVTESIDLSEWVLPVVVTWWKIDEIRLCMDLRRPNGAVVISSQLLPHLDDISHQLAGCQALLEASLAFFLLPTASGWRKWKPNCLLEGVWRHPEFLGRRSREERKESTTGSPGYSTVEPPGTYTTPPCQSTGNINGAVWRALEAVRRWRHTSQMFKLLQAQACSKLLLLYYEPVHPMQYCLKWLV